MLFKTSRLRDISSTGKKLNPITLVSNFFIITVVITIVPSLFYSRAFTFQRIQSQNGFLTGTAGSGNVDILFLR